MKLLFSIILFFSVTLASHNAISGSAEGLDEILERIAEIDASSKINALIDRILITDKSLTAKRRGRVIVIDAGHGGKDPGTSGKNGTVEKFITLQYTLLLGNILKEAGYTVFLTRDGDSYLPLYQRRKLAQMYGGSLMIAIHADAAGNLEARGLSVYTLSDEATDETAKMLAQSHEDSQDINLGSNIKDTNARSALINLAQNATISRSEYFSKIFLQNSAKDRLFVIPNPHRKAGFAVLKTPNVPSVLIELGFLSNPEEEILLASQTYRRQMVQTIFKSIDEFFGITLQ